MKNNKVCKHFSEDIMLLAYGEDLPAAKKKELEIHLKSCSSCRQELSELRSFRKKVKDSINLGKLPEKFWESNLESIKKELTSSSFSRFLNMKLVGSLALACVIALVLAVSSSMKKSSNIAPENQLTVTATVSNQTDTTDKQIVAQIEVLENLDVLENILNIVEKGKTDQG